MSATTAHLDAPIPQVLARWPMLRVGEVFDIQQGKALSAAARGAIDRHPFLRTSNVLWNRIDISSIDGMGMSEEDRFRLALRRGDLLVCEGGEIGRSAVWNAELDECSYQNHIHRLRSRRDISPEFFAFWFRYAFTMADLYRGAGTKTTIANLSMGGLSALLIPFPPLDEQRRIARILSTIQLARDAVAKDLDAKRTARRSLLATLLSPIETTSVSSQDSPYGPIPSDWRLMSLREACSHVVDCPHTTPHFMNQGVLVIRNFNIRDGELDLSRSYYTSEEEYQARTEREKPIPGDLVFSREAPVGEICVITPGTRASLGQRTVLIRPDNRHLLGEYLLEVFYTPQIQRTMEVMSTGVTAPHMNVADVRNLLVPIPPVDVQRRIAQRAAALRAALVSARSYLAEIDRVFDAALAELMGPGE